MINDMVSDLEELGQLLDDNNFTLSDITFIVNFMKKEDISPQLAMRRIKAFDSLKEKMEQNSQEEGMKMLEQELQEVKNQLIQKTTELQELQNQKTGLESEKEELATKSELLDSEREELQRQLEMLRDMQLEDEGDVDNSNLNKIKTELENIMNDVPEISAILKPIQSLFSEITNNNDDMDFERYRKELEDSVNVFKDQLKSKIIETSSGAKPVSSRISSATNEIKSSPLPDEKAEMEKALEEDPIKKKSIDKSDEKKVSEKEEQVINLFIDFIEEAENNKSFKDRVSTICDMDEAYEYLGSIGLSQVYSFASKGMDKKEELLQLLKSWKKDGVPR